MNHTGHFLTQPSPQRTRPEHSQLLEKYLWNASDEDLSKSVLGEELFLLVQSVVVCQDPPIII